MASEEDNFDIDIYGDGEDEGHEEDYKREDSHINLDGSVDDHQNHPEDVKTEELSSATSTINGDTQSHEHPTSTVQLAPSQQSTPAPQQGIKRKESSDERPVDPGATLAVMISDLHWWTTEDDVRGWANQADCEGELKDVTFSEHKVNGKSKGQAFVEFTSAQASSSMKRQIDSLGGGQPGSRKYAVSYSNPHQNPFKTYPKDGPARGKDERPQRTPSSASYNSSGPPANSYNSNNGNGNNTNSGYQGGRGRGGYRGNANNNVGGGFNNNRNFSSPMNQFSAGMGVGFQNNMGAMNNYGGFNNRGGGMMNNRGGMGGMGSLRGGRGANMGGGMQMMGGMGGMGAMRGMGMGMNMGGINPMMTGMGMQGPVGFQGGNPQFNPAFFNPGQAGGGSGADSSWNPHGAKRTRQE